MSNSDSSGDCYIVFHSRSVVLPQDNPLLTEGPMLIIDSPPNNTVKISSSGSDEQILKKIASLSSERSSLDVPQTSGDKIKSARTHQLWSIPKELYNREIGNYKFCTKWKNKFYQSEVALKKLKVSKQLKGHNDSVNSLNFNKTGDLMTSGSNDFTICLWDWSKGKCLIKHDCAHGNITQTKFLPTQSDIHIISSAGDGSVMLSAVNNCNVNYTKCIAHHSRSCNSIRVHNDLPNVILSCGGDGVVKNIDIRDSSLHSTTETQKNLLHIKNSIGDIIPLYGIDINPMNPHEFILNGDDQYVRMFDKRKLSIIPVALYCRSTSNSKYDNDEDKNRISGPRLKSTNFYSYSNVTSAVYNYCGTEILASYFMDDIYLYDVKESPIHYLKRYSGHINGEKDKSVFFYGPRSDYVASGSDNGDLLIWDKKSETIVQSKGPESCGDFKTLEAHPHLPVLATSGRDATIKIWEPLNTCQSVKMIHQWL